MIEPDQIRSKALAAQEAAIPEFEEQNEAVAKRRSMRGSAFFKKRLPQVSYCMHKNC